MTLYQNSQESTLWVLSGTVTDNKFRLSIPIETSCDHVINIYTNDPNASVISINEYIPSVSPTGRQYRFYDVVLTGNATVYKAVIWRI